MGSVTASAACNAAAHHLRVLAVGISLRGQPLAASNRVAGDLEDAQFILGSGPLVDAYEQRSPIEAPDLTSRDWITVSHFDEAGIVAVYAFPLLVGTTCLGVLTAYCSRSMALTDTQRTVAHAHARSAARRTADQLVTRRPLTETDPAQRRFDELHQAVGVVMAQLHVTPDEASARIRAHVYCTGTHLVDVIGDLLHGRLTLPDDHRPSAVPT